MYDVTIMEVVHSMSDLDGHMVELWEGNLVVGGEGEG